MLDWNYWLGRKYAIQQQNADTDKARGMADANLSSVRAGLLPAQSRAEIGLTQAQAAEAVARGRNLDMDTRLAPSIANSEHIYRSALGRQALSTATNTDTETERLRGRMRFGLSIGDVYRFMGLGGGL